MEAKAMKKQEEVVERPKPQLRYTLLGKLLEWLIGVKAAKMMDPTRPKTPNNNKIITNILNKNDCYTVLVF